VSTDSAHVGWSLEQEEPVTVVSGPFRWFEALFDRRTNAHGRVRILLALLHGTIALELDINAIRPRRKT
jgi:hypothetical protein